MMKTHETLHYKNKSVFHTIGFIITVVTNALAVFIPINGKTTGQIAAEYPSLFTPADITFSIWGIIYLLLLAFIIYQLWLAFSLKQPAVLSYLMNNIKDWFMVTSIANAGWLFAWHYNLIPLSMGIMLILLFALFRIHLNFGIALRPATLPEKIFIYLPFSIYLGWISIATLANLAALLSYAGWTGDVPSQISHTIVMIGAGTLLSISMILLRNNIVYALVSVWAFYGILLKRSAANVIAENAIVHACIIAIGMIAVAISWQFYRKQKS
ncbi:hypothetical protein [Chitinophaga nivalis]|uniref:Tryptophan-rich sensory protein n=1 Tax=Chitinophaga nivalis TaxID=2991709 RepID=A0ABT3ILT9_9BACT|nr:hypothetical protein [Chitinophaga nivalis]MCW3465574.1 hypothetical protein [Chitinophaga nivalis]MCW3484735.1 hypothetical protein [Chitinophaga nivalis]